MSSRTEATLVFQEIIQQFLSLGIEVSEISLGLEGHSSDLHMCVRVSIQGDEVEFVTSADEVYESPSEWLAATARAIHEAFEDIGRGR